MSEILQSEESIRLYDHMYIKPELTENFLEHHGILGMHWGQRNGPPYPLSRTVSTGKKLKSSIGNVSKKRKKKNAIKKAKKTRAKNAQIKAQEIKEQKSKEDILKTKDIKAMADNIDLFSNQEIRDVLARIDVEEQLRRKVREVQEQNMPKRQRILRSAKSSAKKGASKAGNDIVSTATENLIKLGTKKVVKELVGNANPELEDYVEKVFPGPKLKKEKEDS